MKPMNQQMPQEMPDEMAEPLPEEMEDPGQAEPQEGGDDLLSSIEAKMQEEGFADNVVSALEGAKDVPAAAGMLAGVLVSKMYDPGDTEEDVMAAIEMALKEIISIAVDMGIQFDEKTATAAAQQAGQIVIDLMDQHEAGGDPEAAQQPPQGLQNPYEGMK